MVKTADVVVIGGGILGASVAHFLVKRNLGTIVLLERQHICSGATRYSAANVRQHYSTEIGVRLAVRAVEMFSHSEESLGGSVNFERCGYMVIVPHGQEPALEKNVPFQQALGVQTELLTPDQIADKYPALNVENIALGSFEHTSGYADPVRTVEALIASAVQRGLRVYEDTPAREIGIDQGRVTFVGTKRGKLSTPIVVNAAGPWAAAVGAMAGVEYRLRLSREHEAVFEIPSDLGALPIVSDVAGGVFFRPHGRNRVLVGEVYPKELEPCGPDDSSNVDQVAVARMARALAFRLPAFGANVTGRAGQPVLGYSGVYSITDDWYPIVGPAPNIAGYYAAVGGSGHSFKIGPPIGEALAALIAQDRPSIDITPLRHSRFAEGHTLGSVWGPGNRG
jgi:glycine/D-amino acid oxidase-like deaminating enzyme